MHAHTAAEVRRARRRGGAAQQRRCWTRGQQRAKTACTRLRRPRHTRTLVRSVQPPSQRGRRAAAMWEGGVMRACAVSRPAPPRAPAGVSVVPLRGGRLAATGADRRVRHHARGVRLHLARATHRQTQQRAAASAFAQQRSTALRCRTAGRCADARLHEPPLHATARGARRASGRVRWCAWKRPRGANAQRRASRAHFFLSPKPRTCMRPAQAARSEQRQQSGRRMCERVCAPCLRACAARTLDRVGDNSAHIEERRHNTCK